MNPKKELNNLTQSIYKLENSISSMENHVSQYKMNTVEINKSIMELNYKKEKLQNEVDTIQEQIYFLASLRESQRPTEDDTDERSLFDKMFGGTDWSELRERR